MIKITDEIVLRKKVRKLGNSKGITFNVTEAELFGLHINDAVEIRIKKIFNKGTL